MIQSVIIATIFLLAVAYIGYLIYRSFRSAGDCPSGCGKCAAVDFAKMEKQIGADWKKRTS